MGQSKRPALAHPAQRRDKGKSEEQSRIAKENRRAAEGGAEGEAEQHQPEQPEQPEQQHDHERQR